MWISLLLSIERSLGLDPLVSSVTDYKLVSDINNDLSTRTELHNDVKDIPRTVIIYTDYV